MATRVRTAASAIAFVGAVCLTAAAWLAGPGAALASTETSPTSGGSDSTLLIAGAIGAAIAAIWLLKPSGSRPPRDRSDDPPAVEHAHRVDREPPAG